MAYCHIQQECRCDAHIEVRNGTMTAGACRVCKPELSAEGETASGIGLCIPWIQADC